MGSDTPMLLQIPPLESSLLVLELVLLVFTFIVVVLIMREARGRGALLKQMVQTATTVSRQEYFTTVVEGIQSAERNVWGIVTGSRADGQEYDTVDRIIEQVHTASSRGVDVRYLIPVSPDRLHMASRYEEAGAKVRFHPALIVNDLRYMIVDGKHVVLGLPRRKGQDEPTRKGYKIPSEGMQQLFRENFEKFWDSPDTLGYLGYLSKIVEDTRKAKPGVSDELLAEQLHVDIEDIRKANSNTPAR